MPPDQGSGASSFVAMASGAVATIPHRGTSLESNPYLGEETCLQVE